MYRLDNSMVTGDRTIALVGCGGTGGFVAEGLCRLFRGTRARIILVDGDRVEERNLLRQNFYPEELGRFKAQVLAERLAMRFRMPVGYALDPLSSPMEQASGPEWRQMNPGVLVGCVDNALARAAMHHWSERWSLGWWVDVGNGEEFGQVLVGNRPSGKLAGAFRQEDGICTALPRPTDQRPELLLPPESRNETERNGTVGNCAEAVAAGEQSPTINLAMAALVLEVVRRIVQGTCSWMQVSLDLAAGTMQVTHATPETVAQMTGVPAQVLVDKTDGRKG
ncbi:MAG: ThiF family adenylyltransferase [Chloroflexota bacterium]|nr:ThiF family adenylyltransferase [Chloroflexota bacterium]